MQQATANLIKSKMIDLQMLFSQTNDRLAGIGERPAAKSCSITSQTKTLLSRGWCLPCAPDRIIDVHPPSISEVKNLPCLFHTNLIFSTVKLIYQQGPSDEPFYNKVGDQRSNYWS